MSEIVVYTAKTIRTMEPSLPVATAVAVRDGRIVELGSLETIRPWLDAHPHRIDRTFEKHVLTPGFIDPHLRPQMAAYLLQCEFITAMEWQLPHKTVAPVRSRDAWLARLDGLDNLFRSVSGVVEARFFRPETPNGDLESGGFDCARYRCALSVRQLAAARST